MSLVEKFFEADLSEAEADQLEALIASSPEAAEQMLALAERDYAATGLPSPVRPGKRSKKLLFWLLGATIAAAAAGAWLLSDDQTPLQVAQEDASNFQEGRLAPEAAPAVHHAKPQPITEDLPRVSAPIRPQANDQHRLGLRVDGAEAGLLKVRVFDASGACVRHVYEGPISKGPHKLSWDGNLDDGTRAQSGRYIIEVQSKAGVSRQELRL